MDSLLEPHLPWGHKQPTGSVRWLLRCCHALPAKAPLSYSLIKLLRAPVKAGRTRALDVNIRGLELRLVNKGNYCETTALFAPQFYDATELRWLTLQLADGGTFLDVGSNVGLYSLFVGAELGNKVRIIAVEPEAELGQRMIFNARQNNIDIHWSPVALSDYDGWGHLHLSKKQSGENCLARRATETSRPTRVMPLLALCRSLGLQSIGALKIDIEGHEHRVLSTFFETAETSLWPRALVAEHVHDQNNTVEMLTGQYGYSVSARTGRNTMLRR